MKALRFAPQHIWTKDSTGNTWICPADGFDANNATDEEIRQRCVEESSNPQNN